MLMVVALVAAGLLFVLLLYPLILAQIGLLITRAPSYVDDIRSWAGGVIADLQQRLGSEYVDEKLRDLVSGQAGAMLGVHRHGADASDRRRFRPVQRALARRGHTGRGVLSAARLAAGGGAGG